MKAVALTKAWKNCGMEKYEMIEDSQILFWSNRKLRIFCLWKSRLRSNWTSYKLVPRSLKQNMEVKLLELQLQVIGIKTFCRNLIMAAQPGHTIKKPLEHDPTRVPASVLWNTKADLSWSIKHGADLRLSIFFIYLSVYIAHSWGAIGVWSLQPFGPWFSQITLNSRCVSGNLGCFWFVLNWRMFW